MTLGTEDLDARGLVQMQINERRKWADNARMEAANLRTGAEAQEERARKYDEQADGLQALLDQ